MHFWIGMKVLFGAKYFPEGSCIEKYFSIHKRKFRQEPFLNELEFIKAIEKTKPRTTRKIGLGLLKSSVVN